MSERFNKLFSLPSNLYTIGSPVVVLAGALLKDNSTDSVFVQLKFQSLSLLRIKALIIELIGYDVAHDIACTIEYQYLDLSVENGNQFGEKKAIIMPSMVVRSFDIKDMQVIFSDDSMWQLSDQLHQLITQQRLELKLGGDLARQYKADIRNPNASFYPAEFEDLWLCSCGTPNKGELCTCCQSSKEIIFEKLDKEELEEHFKIQAEQNAIAAEKSRLLAEELAQKETLEKAKRKKRARNLLFCFCGLFITAVLIFIFYLNPYVLRPQKVYSDIKSLLDAKEYDKAISELLKVKNDTQISSFNIENAAMQTALSLYDAKDYDNAIKIFDALGDFSDASEMSQKAAYEKADNVFLSGDYLSARQLFTNLESYSHSKERVIECTELYNKKIYNNPLNRSDVDFNNDTIISELNANASDNSYKYTLVITNNSQCDFVGFTATVDFKTTVDISEVETKNQPIMAKHISSDKKNSFTYDGIFRSGQTINMEFESTLKAIDYNLSMNYDYAFRKGLLEEIPIDFDDE